MDSQDLKSSLTQSKIETEVIYIGKKLVTIFFLLFSLALFGQSGVNGFLEDFELKTAVVPLSQKMKKPADKPTIAVTVNSLDTLGKVSKYIYGNNVNLWMGQIVTETELMSHIKLLSPNIIRFPGGNISNVYFWDRDVGNEPDDVPDSLYGMDGKKIPADFWWYGENDSSNTISLENYYRLLAETESTGSICVNFSYSRYGTGSDPVAQAAHYAADWVRFDNGRSRFWEIGNEDFGPWQAGFRIDTTLNQDGQPEIINGEIYGKHFLVFADSMRVAAREIGSEIYIGAQLVENLEGNAWNPVTHKWNEAFFRVCGDAADFFIVHSYYTPYEQDSAPELILQTAETETRHMMNYLKQATEDYRIQMKPVALTEWNIFAMGSQQMVSFINGMHATIVLAELADNGFSMACRWDFANGFNNGNDHGMFNNCDEPDVPAWNPHPDFFYMYYFQRFFGDHVVGATVEGNDDLLVYASRFYSGQLGIIVVNKGKSDEIVALNVPGLKVGKNYYLYRLTGGEDNGEFSRSVFVNNIGPTNSNGGPIKGLESIPAWAFKTKGGVIFNSPARSVQFILLEAEAGKHL